MGLDVNVFEDLLIWQASDLARRKQYPEAEVILGLLETSEGKYRSAACDLLGKIKAKQGQYAEAKACFQKAIAFSPNNADLREALACLPVQQRNRRILKWASIATPLLFLVIGVSAFFWRGHSKKETNLLQRTDAGITEIAGAEKGLPGVSEKTSIQDDIEWPSIDISGVAVTHGSSEMRIVFDQGVFTDKCGLSAEGQRLIRAVAEKIKPSVKTLFVIIEGHADNLPVYDGSPFKDNLYLGLMRAETIVGLLHTEYGLPKSMLLAVSAGEKAPLYSNDTDEARHKNRTVSIRILPIR